MNVHQTALEGAEHTTATSFASLCKPALRQAFIKLDPRTLARSPVMLVVELTAVLTSVLCLLPSAAVSTGVAVQIALWLWFTVLFAVCLQTSFLTPPVGFALFYLKGVAPEGIRTPTIYRGVLPFVALQIAGLGVLFLWPSIVTWLPRLAYR